MAKEKNPKSVVDRKLATNLSEQWHKAKPTNPVESTQVTESLPSDDPRMAARKPVGKRPKQKPFAKNKGTYVEEEEGATFNRPGDSEHGRSIRAATTDYPRPTSSNPSDKAYEGLHAHVRPVRQRAGVTDDVTTHSNLVKKLSTAPEHQIEAIKAQISAHVNAKGYAYGVPSACQGTGCRNTIPFDADQDLCAGDSCSTASAKRKPTPR